MTRPDRRQVQGYQDVVSVVVGGLAGALLAFSGTLVTYSVLSPVLALGHGPLSQPQVLGAGVVPVLTLLGFLVGALLASRRWMD